MNIVKRALCIGPRRVQSYLLSSQCNKLTSEAQFTIPSVNYFKQDIYDCEQNSVFLSSWLLVGQRNALLPKKGSFAQVTVAGQNLVLVRNDDSSYVAYYNVCSHRAHELVSPGSFGILKSKALTCPNHGWTFRAATGELIKARFSEDAVNFCRGDFDLKKVHIKEMSGLIFVNLSDSEDCISVESNFSPELSGVLAEKIPGIASGDMTRLAVKENVINANWKILTDNFLECYHCDIAHKAFVDMVDLDHYTTALGQRHVLFESSCKPENKAYNFSADDPLQSAFFCWLWPNSVVYSAPGQPNMSILQFIPLSPTTTLRRSERFAMVTSPTAPTSDSDADSETQQQAEARVNYLNQVLLEEDTSICESVQRGVQSRAYQKGRLIVSATEGEQKWHTEIAVAHFHQLLRDHMDTGSA